jgi:hypothetical protein
MIKTKWLCIAFSLCASALSACGSASNFEDRPAPDVDAPENVGESQQAIGNLCENVRIEVKNRFEEDSGARPDIKVTAISFFNADKGSAGRWNKQSVSNEVIGYDDEYPYTEDLEGADGDTITKWRVHHKHDLGNGWGNEVIQEINTADVNCSDGMTVELTVTT